ncbi:MAG: DUF1549 domain-containing protein, partial [Gemmataceae bacterium]
MIFRSIWLSSYILLFYAFPIHGFGSEISANDREFFESKIRPLLIDQCQDCHGAKKSRGGLRIDSREAFFKGGDTGSPVVAGHPEKSLLIKAVSYEDALRMPPRNKLKDEEIELLREWVKKGAPWPAGPSKSDTTSSPSKFPNVSDSHWSFQTRKSNYPPSVRDSSWTLTPVDRFILAKLENRGITPSPKADNRALLRRASFDLTGLPPSIEDLKVFLGDDKPGAWARAVDRLLASPAYGERWGRHWLDLVRFAETSGHEFDFDIPNAWKYRDYVIRALNEDTPYDQFALEHIAGDMLPSPRRHPKTGTNESILGTGFWFLGESKHSPVDLRVDGADRRDNMIDVFGKSFLGLTLACARCHDHKFDPIPTKDYYSLVSVLQSSRFQHAFLDHPDRQLDRLESLQRLRLEAEVLARTETVDVLSQK